MPLKIEKNILILLAEDCEIVRFGLKAILEQQNDFEVIAESSSCKDTLQLTERLKPDVILLDLTLTDGESVNYISKLRDINPASKILIFTSSIDKEIHLLALHFGAVGILLKDHSSEIICKAVRHVHLKNELWIDQKLISELWKLNKKTSTPLSQTKNQLTFNTLTPREKQIACLLSKGMKANNIGKKLFISEKTVRNQLTTIYSKLSVKNQLELLINYTEIEFCIE